jgi:hypothetical protein
MPLQKKPARTSRPRGASFRFTDTGFRQLKVLATALNMSQIEIIETLLADEYERCRKKYPEDFRKAERQIESEK